jgi:hypothetical protein
LGGRRRWCGSHGAGFLLPAFDPGGEKDANEEQGNVSKGANQVFGFVIHRRVLFLGLSKLKQSVETARGL